MKSKWQSLECSTCKIAGNSHISENWDEHAKHIEDYHTYICKKCLSHMSGRKEAHERNCHPKSIASEFERSVLSRLNKIETLLKRLVGEHEDTNG